MQIEAMAYLVSAQGFQQTYGAWPNYAYGDQRDWQTTPGWPNYGEQREWQTPFVSPSYGEQTDWPMSPPSNYCPETDLPPEDVPPEEGEVRKITEEQRFVYETIGEMLDEVIEEEQDIEEEKPSTRCVKCLDYCCQACTCSPSALCRNPCRRSSAGESDRITPLEIMTPVLRQGRAAGWRMWKKFAFPLVNNIVRDVWIVTQLLFTLTALALSAATISHGKNKNFDIFHLSLSAFSTALATIDAISNLSHCKSCKQCKKKCSSQQNANTGQECRKYLDMVRMLASELILYTLLICSMFGFITGKPWKSKEAKDIISVILFCLSLLGMVLYVYVLRIVILGYLIKFVHQQRKPKSNNPAYWQRYDYDPDFSKSGLYFQVYFFVHVLGQMIAQILSLIAIGAKIENDIPENCMGPNIQYVNESCIGAKTPDVSGPCSDGNIQYDNRSCDCGCAIQVSGFLWYMLASGYVLPICGILTFFIVTYYWVQEFPIGICLDVLSLLRMPNVNTIFYPNESTAKVRKKVDELQKCLSSSSLKQQFMSMRNKAVLSDKFLFPFKSPARITLSIIYGSLQFGFILCASHAIINGQVQQMILTNDEGWIIFYALSVAFGVLANIYVFLVAAVWVIIIAGIIMLIALIISGLILCFFMAVCINSDR